jgi:hypothetical protein
MFASAVRAENNLPDGTSGGNISDGKSKRQVKNRKKQAEKRWKKVLRQAWIISAAAV